MRRALQEGQTTAALAGECDEALGGARVAADAGEAVGEDAAAEVAIALAAGFADQAHFTRVFKQIIGTTPGAFRAAARQPSSPPLP